MKLINVDAFKEDYGMADFCEGCKRDARKCQYDVIFSRMDFCGWLDDAEEAVVRCKDCKCSRDTQTVEFMFCENIMRMMPSDGFCSLGERG